MSFKNIRKLSPSGIPLCHKAILAATVPLMTALLMLAATPASAQWNAPAEAEGYKSTIKSSAKSIEAGRKVYVKYCVLCHGETGDGKGPSSKSLSVPPAAFNNKSSQSDGSLAWKILSGKGPMPSWAPVLSEDDIWNVINYIRKFEK